MKGIYAVCLMVISLLFANSVQAQEIAGKVVDSASGKPMPGVSIYLNGTYQGTSSDNEGNFKIHTTETHIPLIVSYVGYQSQTVTDYKGKALTVLLKRKDNVLHEVTIGFNAMSRDDEMQLFLREFIGNARSECTISNPDVITFTYSKKAKQLKATADEPLIIYNKKLGYKITYFLLAFNYLPTALSYQGNYFFAEDTTGLKPAQVNAILKAREAAYIGSRMHFIRSVWDQNTIGEGFVVYDKHNGLVPDESLIDIHGDEKFLRFYSYLRVYHGPYVSNLEQPTIGREIFIAENGYYDPYIFWNGDMARQRVGDTLPFEFQPQKKGKKTIAIGSK